MSTPEIVQDPPPIDVWPDGSLRVAGSRIRIEWPLSMFREGHPVEAITATVTGLGLPEAYSLCAYYVRHKAELDAYIAERRAREVALIAEHRRLHPQAEFAAQIRARAAQLDAQASR